MLSCDYFALVYSLSLSLSLSPSVPSFLSIPSRLCPLLQDSVVDDSLAAVSQCLQTPLHELAASNTGCTQPVFSPSLQCASSLVNVSLRILAHAAELEDKTGGMAGKGEREDEEERKEGEGGDGRGEESKAVVSLQVGVKLVTQTMCVILLYSDCTGDSAWTVQQF